MASQHDVSKMIVEYLCEKFNANMYYSAERAPLEKGYLVRYSHDKIRNNNESWPKAEDVSLYIGGKYNGEGNDNRIAIPDVALLKEDDKKIKLLVEVETGTNFKRVLKSIGPIALADVYSPSYKYPKNHHGSTNYSTDGNDYSIDNTVLFILVLDKERKQHEKMRKHPIRISRLDDDSIRICVYFDYAEDPFDLFSKFKNRLETISDQL